ncbi:hypothetical protein C7445_106104 [Alicyclobacillus sacchari]|uniref:Uncharacterized protein n=1 Tax=Alicyclobacillus sacchari TaxID=392010 RepID=A0A4V3HEF3_9BACL|nr:hypothetical protein [Alicyclobacillus sacchari]TDY46678.1 hypothetical protein C7445_106104 [Alicyclobacillus sacchari]GMA58767.1 hypothetical protein GCM10025858_32700 [Alicyclobacillus sacchari]
MQTIRTMFRLFRTFSMLYTLWRGSRATQLLYIGSMVWRFFRGQKVRPRPPRVVVTFVDPHTDAIYKRRGWRRIERRPGR